MMMFPFSRSNCLRGIAVLSLWFGSGIPAVQALPEYQDGGSHGVSGLRKGANQEISVDAQRAFVRWQGFNVEAGETFRIKGNASQTLLNLVTGSDPSRIGGMVDSGVRFILANPNGISLVKGGQIVAPSVLLTTAKFNPQEWLKGLTDTSGVVGESGYLRFDKGSSINVEGTIHALESAGGVGGSIRLLADQLRLGSTAVLQATGAQGGGEILVGGSWQNSTPVLGQATRVLIEQGAVLDASALFSGDGGTIVAWSDITNPQSRTEVHGRLSARGGAEQGRGGRVETSGAWIDVEGSVVNTLAADGGAGYWLLDPTSLYVGTSSDGTASTGSRSILSLAQLNTNLDTNGTVSLQASQDIVLDADFTFDGSTGDADRTLIFDAPLTVLLGSIDVEGTQTEQLNVEIGTTTSQNLAVMSANRSIQTNDGDITIRGNVGGGQGLTLDAGSGVISLGDISGGLSGSYWDGTSSISTTNVAANTTLINYTGGPGTGNAIVLDFANGVATRNGSALAYTGTLPSNLKTGASGVFC